jgi:isochorismate synthase EntC
MRPILQTLTWIKGLVMRRLLLLALVPLVACGTPRERAASWLREHEALERGWYAGGVGFVDPDGGGELGVALRSGLLRRSQARLYAGAGLVVASNPEAELSETRLKLRTLLSQLTEI